ncbi:hypothetical protein, partial [Hymenobacter agri]
MTTFLSWPAPWARPAYYLRPLVGAGLLAATLFATGCSQDAELAAPASPTAATYPADAAHKWADMELRLIKNGT